MLRRKSIVLWCRGIMFYLSADSETRNDWPLSAAEVTLPRFNKMLLFCCWDEKKFINIAWRLQEDLKLLQLLLNNFFLSFMRINYGAPEIILISSNAFTICAIITHHAIEAWSHLSLLRKVTVALAVKNGNGFLILLEHDLLLQNSIKCNFVQVKRPQTTTFNTLPPVKQNMSWSLFLLWVEVF